MRNILDGGLAPMVASLLGNVYLPATLHQRSLTPNGKGGFTEATADIPCRAQVDQATHAMRQADGFSETDVSILVLAHGLDGGITSDFEITVRGTRWHIINPSLDPCMTHWIMRGRPKT